MSRFVSKQISTRIGTCWMYLFAFGSVAIYVFCIVSMNLRLIHISDTIQDNIYPNSEKNAKNTFLIVIIYLFP